MYCTEDVRAPVCCRQQYDVRRGALRDDRCRTPELSLTGRYIGEDIHKNGILLMDSFRVHISYVALAATHLFPRVPDNNMRTTFVLPVSLGSDGRNRLIAIV